MCSRASRDAANKSRKCSNISPYVSRQREPLTSQLSNVTFHFTHQHNERSGVEVNGSKRKGKRLQQCGQNSRQPLTEHGSTFSNMATEHAFFLMDIYLVYLCAVDCRNV